MQATFQKLHGENGPNFVAKISENLSKRSQKVNIFFSKKMWNLLMRATKTFKVLWNLILQKKGQISID